MQLPIHAGSDLIVSRTSFFLKAARGTRMQGVASEQVHQKLLVEQERMQGVASCRCGRLTNPMPCISLASFQSYLPPSFLTMAVVVSEV
jgi:hypothetical protein